MHLLTIQIINALLSEHNKIYFLNISEIYWEKKLDKYSHIYITFLHY